MITVSSITPGKNSTNVSVNQDLELRIEADFKLDPRNISFKLNNVEVVPSVFSIYHGITDHELVVSLYTKRRIKFGDDYRYGQRDLKYGMRDLFPSVLEYNSRYICSFTVWGTNENGEEEKISDSFVFTTEEGIFENSNPTDYFYSSHTQSLANRLPDWSRARYDKYSNFQQLLNPLGEALEKSQALISNIFKNSTIQTADLNELSLLYKYDLDKNFEFKKFFNQDGSPFFVQPDISGVQGITRFDLFAPEENTLKSLYYKKLPTRINTEETRLSDNTLVYGTLASELEIPLNKTLEREGTCVIYCLGVNTSVYKDPDTKYSFLKCKIKGISIFDKEEEEEIVIYNERYLYTRKSWKKLVSIQFFNLKKQEITFKILHFPDPLRLITDSKRITNVDGTSDLAIWSLDNRNQISVLQRNRTIGESALDVLKFGGRTEVVSESGLYDIDNETPIELLDIASDPNSNFAYGVTNDFLYIFDKREAYPRTLKKIPGNNGSADFSLTLVSDASFLDENGLKEILIKCIQSIPGRKVVKYRIKVTKPDNSIIFILKDGTITSDPSTASIFLKVDSYIIDPIENSYNADMAGEYLFELETMYSGGDISRDFSFAHIVKNCALAKYKLQRILGDAVPVSIFIDTDQELKIYTDISSLHKIKFHKDGIVIDYINKVIYSSEEYTSIDVD